MTIRIDDADPAILTRPGDGNVIGSGPTPPPSNSVGWAHGAVFLNTDGTLSSDAMYVNTGTKAESNFQSFSAMTTFSATALSAETVTGTNLTLNSTNEFNLQFGGVSGLAIDDAAIVSNAGASDVAGKSVFIETQDGGADFAEVVGRAAGNFSFTAGIGSATTLTDGDGGNSGCIALVTQAGGAPNGSGATGRDGVIALLSASGASGIFVKQAATGTAKTSAGNPNTLTAAEMLAGIVPTGGTAACTITLTTGGNLDLAINSSFLGADVAFDWVLINTGTSSGAVTITASTGHVVTGDNNGNMTVAIGVSARLRTRRIGTSSYATYRIS